MTVRDDAVYEPTESFSLVLSAPTHGVIGIGTAPGRIRDTDLPTVRVLGGSVKEGAAAVVPMKVSIQGHANVPVTVNYATGDLAEAEPRRPSTADYTPTTGTLTFVPGAALTQTVNVPVVNDTAWEADAERFTFTATNPANGQIATAPGTILDDEAHPPVVSIGNVVVKEGEVDEPGLDPGDAGQAARRRDPGPVLDRERHRRRARPTTARWRTSRSCSRPAR